MFFSKSTVFEKFFQKNDQSVKQFGSRSDPTCSQAYVGSGLGPNCLQTTLLGKELNQMGSHYHKQSFPYISGDDPHFRIRRSCFLTIKNNFYIK